MKLLPTLLIAIAITSLPAEAASRKKAARHPLLPPIPKPTEPSEPGKLFTTNLGGKDLRFLSEAIEFGLSQVFLSSLATERAQSERVKLLAGLLSQTQREENSKLSRLAALKDVTLTDRDAAAQDGITRQFAKIPADQFDSKWMETVVALNEKVLANYKIGAESADADIRDFAKKALPLAQEKLGLITGRGASAAPKFRTQNSQPQPR